MYIRFPTETDPGGNNYTDIGTYVIHVPFSTHAAYIQKIHCIESKLQIKLHA